MIVVSIPPHAEIGPNAHREDSSRFIKGRVDDRIFGSFLDQNIVHVYSNFDLKIHVWTIGIIIYPFINIIRYIMILISGQKRDNDRTRTVLSADH